jgi:uncharacterized tellurite resistance protein B-like protein
MIKFFKDILSQKDNSDVVDESRSDEANKVTKLQIATCALFLEAAKSDDEFLDIEKTNIINVMKNIFRLDNQSINHLMKLAEHKQQESISLYEYTDIINYNFTKAEKYEVLKYLWRLILIDENLDSYEAQFMRKITGNLKMNHSDMIASKMEVKAELGGKN